MTEEELRQVYFELIQDDLNNFKGQSLDKVKSPIKLAVDKLVEDSFRDKSVASESIGGHLSQTFFQVDGFPDEVKGLIRPYRKLRW